MSMSSDQTSILGASDTGGIGLLSWMNAGRKSSVDDELLAVSADDEGHSPKSSSSRRESLDDRRMTEIVRPSIPYLLRQHGYLRHIGNSVLEKEKNIAGMQVRLEIPLVQPSSHTEMAVAQAQQDLSDLSTTTAEQPT
jgi:hypothetical protein